MGCQTVVAIVKKVKYLLLLTTFQFAWKTATPLALVSTKHCSDLALLYIDNQHIFLENHAAIFMSSSGGKTNQLDHFPPQVHIDSHSNVNLCPFIGRVICSVMSLLGGGWMDCI